METALLSVRIFAMTSTPGGDYPWRISPSSTRESPSGEPLGPLPVGWSIIALLVPVLFFIGLAIRERSEGKRLAGFEKWARRQGFGFVYADEELGQEMAGALAIWSGRSHCAKDVVVMPSRHGSCLYGRLEWKENSGKYQTTRDCCFVRYELKAPLPFFLAKPENEFSRKYDDISTEWDEFNRRWEIQAFNREFALALLSPTMQEFMMKRMWDLELRVDGQYAYLKFPQGMFEYYVEESVYYRNLMKEWEDKVVPYLWQGTQGQ